jgi:hypothetical protein
MIAFDTFSRWLIAPIFKVKRYVSQVPDEVSQMKVLIVMQKFFALRNR